MPPDLFSKMQEHNFDFLEATVEDSNVLDKTENSSHVRKRKVRDVGAQPRKRRGRGGGGGGGGGEAVSCPRGGRPAQPNQDNQTRAQMQHANRLGPEGLGDQNDVDNPWEEGENEMDVSSDVLRVHLPPGASDPVPEEPVLSHLAINIISALASVARDCIQQSANSGIISNVHALVGMLQDSKPTPELCDSSTSLAILAKRCKKSEVLEACSHLTYWLSVLLFACQMNLCVLHIYTLGVSSLIPIFHREMAASSQAKYTIFQRIISESDPDGVSNARTLDRYFQDGLMTAVLCGAGSFYMLFLMAASRIRPEIRKLKGSMQGRIAKLIRCPPGKSSTSGLVFI